MPDKRPALGRGLSALIPNRPASSSTDTPSAASAPSASAAVAAPSARPLEVDIDRLSPNARQPRTHFEEQSLEELAQSIRSNGVIQPILVRKAADGFEIVAGERRWRAAQRAGLLKVPVVLRDVPDEKLLEVALIENIQRENLNPIEEAQAYRKLSDELQLSQEAIATAVGKDRATIANYMRLLRLPVEVRQALSAGAVSMGHARALLALSDEAGQRRVAREVVSRGLSVRETEMLVRREASPKPPAAAKPVDANTRAAEEHLKLALGTRTRIVRSGARGRIEIDFASETELQRLYEQLVDSSR